MDKKNSSVAIHSRPTRAPLQLGALDSSGKTCEPGDDSYEPVMLTLTLALWTFMTFYVILFLIHYLRRIQYFSLYDKCTPKNAHFRYDFHIVFGKCSSNYNMIDSQVILDLLDNQLISTMTIQVPGSYIFNDNQVFLYKHSRANIRCVNFSIYRRHPVKDVRCVRVAHSCGNPDSRIYVYGIDLYDSTNGENTFFPVTSVVKYRGTQWALVATFEPKAGVNFQKMGVNCYDPFGYSTWPTYLEILTVLLYNWCSAFCFGYLISVNEILGSVSLHSLTILFLTGTSTLVICIVYLRFIKNHIVGLHYDSIWWLAAQHTYFLAVFTISLAFWFLATNQAKRCENESFQWIVSTLSSSTILTVICALTYLYLVRRKRLNDNALMNETDNNLAKTSSKPNMELSKDPVASWWFCGGGGAGNRAKPSSSKQTTAHRQQHKNSTTFKTDAKTNPNKSLPITRKKRSDEKRPDKQTLQAAQEKKEGSDETLDTAVGSKYIKTKNRNSIAQYV